MEETEWEYNKSRPCGVCFLMREISPDDISCIINNESENLTLVKTGADNGNRTRLLSLGS